MTDTNLSLTELVNSRPWYHTIDLPGGIVTPGEYDHRPIVDKVPLPARLDGKRCIDVGTHDGFWAFEMAKRGASGVVAIDVPTADDIDWPEPRPVITDELRAYIQERKRTFEIANEALGANVDRRFVSVYDLQPENVGTFDLAFLGTLLHHLRDPIGALQGIRRVVNGPLVLVGIFSPLKTALLPFTPVTELLEHGGDPFYEMPNLAGLRRQLELGGWKIEQWGRPHLQTYGAGWKNPPIAWKNRASLRTVPRQLMLRKGALHISVVATPR